jgi:hypothetical protein
MKGGCRALCGTCGTGGLLENRGSSGFIFGGQKGAIASCYDVIWDNKKFKG